jgi:glutaredoxin
MADDSLPELWQAEWCPHSAIVRERLTELGVDFVCRQVAPDPDERTGLMEATGYDTIPVVVFADGEVVGGRDEDILAALDARYPDPPTAEEHAQVAEAHGVRPARRTGPDFEG